MLERGGERRWREVHNSPFLCVRLKPFYIASPAACSSNVHFVGLTVRRFLFQLFHESCHPRLAFRNFHGSFVLAVNLNALATSSWCFDSVSCVQEISTWPALSTSCCGLKSMELLCSLISTSFIGCCVGENKNFVLDYRVGVNDLGNEVSVEGSTMALCHLVVCKLLDVSCSWFAAVWNH